VLDSHVELALISFIAIGAILMLLIFPVFRIFQILIISLPLDATLVIEKGFKIIPTYLVLLYIISLMLVTRDFWYTKSPMDIAIFFFLGVCTFSIIQTAFVPPPQVKFMETMKYRGAWFRCILQLFLLYFYSLIYFFTAHLCGNDKKRLDIAIKTYIIVATVIATYGIYQGFATHFGLPLKNVTNAMQTRGYGYGGSFTSVEFGRYRSQATFGEPLGFGHYILSVLPLLIAFVSVTKSYRDAFGRKWMSGITLAGVTTVFFIALFMTRARGPLISFAAAIGVTILLLRLRHIHRFLGVF